MPIQAANQISTNLPLGKGYYPGPGAFEESAGNRGLSTLQPQPAAPPSLPASLTPADAWEIVETVRGFVKTRPPSLALNLHHLADPSLLGSNYV